MNYTSILTDRETYSGISIKGYQNIRHGLFDVISQTSLVALNRIFGERDIELYAKLEYLNPGGSAKDRSGFNMINPTKITVREAVAAYIDSKRSVIAASTLYGYEVAAKNRLQSVQGYNITDLKIIDIQRAINIDAERGLGYKSISDTVHVSDNRIFRQILAKHLHLC